MSWVWQTCGYSLDQLALVATGPKNRLVKGDVLEAIKRLNATGVEPTTPSALVQDEPKSQSSASALPVAGRRSRGYVDLPVTTMRKIIASRCTCLYLTHPS